MGAGVATSPHCPSWDYRRRDAKRSPLGFRSRPRPGSSVSGRVPVQAEAWSVSRSARRKQAPTGPMGPLGAEALGFPWDRAEASFFPHPEPIPAEADLFSCDPPEPGPPGRLRISPRPKPRLHPPASDRGKPRSWPRPNRNPAVSRRSEASLLPSPAIAKAEACDNPRSAAGEANSPLARASDEAEAPPNSRSAAVRSKPLTLARAIVGTEAPTISRSASSRSKLRPVARSIGPEPKSRRSSVRPRTKQASLRTLSAEPGGDSPCPSGILAAHIYPKAPALSGSFGKLGEPKLIGFPEPPHPSGWHPAEAVRRPSGLPPSRGIRGCLSSGYATKAVRSFESGQAESACG
jgi:hypothetical protein